jgi:hypothetical protein
VTAIKVIVEYPHGVRSAAQLETVGAVARSVRQALHDSEKRGIVSITVRRRKKRGLRR